jgi:predicted RNase H-related nuclease YkuK (DUF458 family)
VKGEDVMDSVSQLKQGQTVTVKFPQKQEIVCASVGGSLTSSSIVLGGLVSFIYIDSVPHASGKGASFLFRIKKAPEIRSLEGTLIVLNKEQADLILKNF